VSSQREITRRADARALKAKQLRDRGLSLRQIAEELGGVSRKQACKIVKRGSALQRKRVANGML